MGNITITNLDMGSPILQGGEFRDELLTLAGAGTIKAGTILARDSVSLKLVKFVVGGSTNENGIPKAILPYEVVATGAGDVAIRAGISGSYRKERLVIDADGDGSNITAAIVDKLRDYALIPVNVTEQNIQDNQ